MKKNLHRVNYDGTPNDSGRWWVWKEICDRCGKIIFDESTQHSYHGNESELDFCVECLRYLMDNNISYEEASILFGKNR